MHNRTIMMLRMQVNYKENYSHKYHIVISVLC